MAGQGAGEVAALVDRRLDRLVDLAPGMALAVHQVGVAMGGEQNGRNQGRETGQRLHAPFALLCRQAREPVVVACGGEERARQRIRRLAVAAGDGRRRGFALQAHQKREHLMIERGDELLEIRSQHEAGMLQGKRRHHRRGIADLDQPHPGQVLVKPLHAASIGLQGLGQRREHGILVHRHMRQPQGQHPSIGQCQPQPGRVVVQLERRRRHPQPRAHQPRLRRGKRRRRLGGTGLKSIDGRGLHAVDDDEGGGSQTAPASRRRGRAMGRTVQAQPSNA